MTMKYEIGKTSRLGNRKTNQDYVGTAESDNAVVLVLGDGMGGHQGGDIASETFVNSVLDFFETSVEQGISSPSNFLKQAIRRGHHAVLDACKQYDPPLNGRSTAIVCLIIDGFAQWAHVGDSRLFVLRYGEIIKQTVDHSLVEELFQAGRITEAEKATHPERNLITRCVGSETVPPVPSFSPPTPLERNDVLLLCSDGLWGPLKPGQFATPLVGTGDLDGALMALADLAESTSYPHSDNISAVAFRWLSNAPVLTGSLPSSMEEMEADNPLVQELHDTVDDEFAINMDILKELNDLDDELGSESRDTPPPPDAEDDSSGTHG